MFSASSGIFYFSHILQVWKIEVIKAKLEIYLSKHFLVHGKIIFIKWSLFPRAVAPGMIQIHIYKSWTLQSVFLPCLFQVKLAITWTNKGNGAICFAIMSTSIWVYFAIVQKGTDTWISSVLSTP